MFSSIVSQLRKRPSLFAMLALLATAVSVIRICASYRELSSTIDEPYYLATGMQFLDHNGRYTYPSSHPPAAEFSAALLPYLDGARSHDGETTYSEGLGILHGQESYWRTLSLERLGILPFYLIGVFLLWSWSKRMYGDEAAFLTVLCYTLIPPVLAFAGIANTDLPLTSVIVASCYALWWWIQRPNWKRSIVLGIVIGISACTKLTFLLFFPIAAVVIILYEYFVLESFHQNVRAISRIMGFAGLTLLISCLTIWAIYGFSTGTIPDGTQILAGGGSLRSASQLSGAVVPAPEFIGAISAVSRYSTMPSVAYLLGRAYKGGNPLFFPIALAVKTPIALLLAVLFASFLVFSRWNKLRASDEWRKNALLPLLISCGMLLSVLPSHINFGIHHILPIYPFLSMLGALSIAWLWQKYGVYGKACVGCLILWMFVSSISYDPDRLAYFNEFTSASSNPPVLLGGLDWGQDLDKLADTLHTRGISSVTMKYFGTADLRRHGMTGFAGLTPFVVPNTEWVAISKWMLFGQDGYAWLRNEPPTARIGNSILLYRFTGGDIDRLRSTLSGTSRGNDNSKASNDNSNILADIARAEALANGSPKPGNFLDLSLVYYKAGRYVDCIDAARKAIDLKPDYAAAYNNICAANNRLGNFAEGKKAAEEALRIEPDNQLAKNNLKLSLDGLNKK